MVTVNYVFLCAFFSGVGVGGKAAALAHVWIFFSVDGNIMETNHVSQKKKKKKK